MDFTIPDELKMLQTLTREFVENELMPLEKEIDEKDYIPDEEYRRLVKRAVELGLWAPCLTCLSLRSWARPAFALPFGLAAAL